MKGQFPIGTALTVMGAIIAAVISSWATASNRVGMVEKNVAVVEEREGNHYRELTNKLEKMDDKLDKLLENKATKR